jgi:hypothetical protein
MLNVLIFLFLLCCQSVVAIVFTQNFTLADNTRAIILSDGSRINGNAVVIGNALQLTDVRSTLGTQRGEFIAPALPGSSLGWTCSFTLRFIGGSPPADGFGVVWGNVSSFVGRNLIRPVNTIFMDIARTGPFVAGMIDTFSNNVAFPAGFVVANTTLLAIVPTSPLSSNEVVTNARIDFAWNPARGITLRTRGFRANAMMNDVNFDHRGSDMHSWWFVGETGAFTESATIDDIVITVPCPECRAGGGTCVWREGGEFECRRPTTTTTRQTSSITTSRVLMMDGNTRSTTTPMTTDVTTDVVSQSLNNPTTVEWIVVSMSNESETDTASSASAPNSDSERVEARDNAVVLTKTELGIIIGVVVGVIVLLVVVTVVLLVWRQRKKSSELAESTTASSNSNFNDQASTSQRTQVYGMLPSSEQTQYTNAGLSSGSALAEYDAITSPLR